MKTRDQVQAELSAEYAANQAKSQSHYVVRKIEREYKVREEQLLSGNAVLDAVIAIQDVPGAAGPNATFEGHVREDAIARGSSAEFRNQAKLALIMAYGKEASFKGTAAGIEVRPAGTTLLPDATVGQFVRATVRGQAPRTAGVQTITDITPLGKGSYCRFEAKVDERAIIASRPGGTLAYAEGVEWSLLTGAAAKVVSAYQGGALVGLTLTDMDAPFGTRASVGDFVELAAGTPETDVRILGHYRVERVSPNSVLLSSRKYARLSAGRYQLVDEELPTFDDTCDWRLLRTQQDVVYLADAAQTFQGVQPDDWLRTAWQVDGAPSMVTWKVVTVPVPGLILLGKEGYLGAQAPYALNNTVNEYFERTVAYGVYRAPEGLMATFKITDSTSNFQAFLKAGDYVELANRTEILEPTTNPAKVPGLYRVESIAAGTVNLGNVRHKVENGAFVEDLDAQGERKLFYDNVADVARYRLSHYEIRYPYATLYRITDVVESGKLVMLDPKPYAGYGGYQGDYRQLAEPLADFDDLMDFEVLSTYENQLFLVDVRTDLAAKVAAGDFVRLDRRSIFPASTNAETMGLFKVITIPRKDVLFLERVRYRGIEPPYTAEGPVTTLFTDFCDYRVTRVFDKEYSRILLTCADPVFGGVAPGDFVEVSAGTTLMNGAWRVKAKLSSRQIQIDGLVKFRRDGEIYTGITMPFAMFSGPVAFKVTRYADRTTGLSLSRDKVFEGLLAGTPEALKDIVRVRYDDRVQLFAVTGVTGAALALHPFMLTGADGSYQVGATPLRERFSQKAATFEVIRATDALDEVLLYLSVFADVIPKPRRDELDEMFTALLSPISEDRRFADPLVDAARMACDQIALTLDSEVPVGDKNVTPRAAADGLGFFYDVHGDFKQDFMLRAVLAHSLYQQAVAVAAVADLGDALVKKTFSELKDIYVDAKLREDGYVDQEAYLRSLPMVNDGPWRAGELAATAMGRAVAIKNRKAVEAAFTKRERPDLATSIASQTASFAAMVLDLIWLGVEDEGEFKRRFWVVPWNLLGPTVQWLNLLGMGLTSDVPAVKRAAVKGRIGVPADPSLRALRRSHALKRNRVRHNKRSKADLEAHRDTATNPDVKLLLNTHVEAIAGVIAVDEVVVNQVATELLRRGEMPREMADALPSDAQATATSFANADDLPAPTEGVVPSASTVEMTGSALASSVPAPRSASTATASVASGIQPSKMGGGFESNITNLFDSDFHDFRRSGVIMPLDALNSAAGANNKDQLSSIYLTDLAGGEVGGLKFDHAGGYEPSRYNHFILTSVPKRFSEKYQVMDTLSEGWVAFAFGKAPEVWSVSGLLINDTFSDQLTRFVELWEEELRITQLAKKGRRMAISVPAAGCTIFCYGLDLAVNVDASQNESVVPFSMQVLVADYVIHPLFKQSGRAAEVAKAITMGDGGMVLAVEPPAKASSQEPPAEEVQTVQVASADLQGLPMMNPGAPAGSAASPATGYIVKKGDTLLSIARRNGVTLAELRAANPGLFKSGLDAKGRKRAASGHWIYPGDKVVIPGKKTHTSPGSKTRSNTQTANQSGATGKKKVAAKLNDKKAKTDKKPKPVQARSTGTQRPIPYV